MRLKRKENKNFNHFKRMLAAMIPLVESAEARRKAKLEEEQLDQQIAARVKKHHEKFYKDL